MRQLAGVLWLRAVEDAQDHRALVKHEEFAHELLWQLQSCFKAP
jgi:hypothetical protein